MELRGEGATETKALLDQMADEDLDIGEFYDQLQDWCGERRLVDKTTTYALDPAALERAAMLFPEAHYIHLLRHPCATLKSYVDVRLDQFLRFDNPFYTKIFLTGVLLTLGVFFAMSVAFETGNKT